MNILLGNNHLKDVGGTENYTYALAVELKRQGHNVEYFAFERGEVAKRLESQGIPFMQQSHYDLILANHTPVVDCLSTLGYTVQTCHGIFSELEQPSNQADRFVAVSKEVHDYLKKDKGYDSEIILNGINCERFYPQRPVNSKPKKVLSLCQSDKANDFIKECCKEEGFEVICINKLEDKLWEVEDAINNVDIVVGIGRSLYDAMACGRPVISYDFRYYADKPMGDGYITKENIEQKLAYNLSGRASSKTFTKELFIQALREYKPEDGAWLREFALKRLNITEVAKRYIMCNGSTTPEKILEKKEFLFKK